MLSEYSGPRALALWHEMRALPPAANLYRVYYEFCRRTGLHKRRYRAGAPTDAELLAALGGRFSGPQALADHLRSRRTPFFFDWRRRKEYAAILNGRFAADRARCIELADAVCAHRFDLMGCHVEFPGEIDWHRLLEKEKSWPRRHWSAIDIRCPAAPGDVKTTWELNRHQFWLHLGRAYWYTGQEKYPAEWARQLKSWIEQNPVEIGVNWASNLEHAMRAVSWAWSLNFFLDSAAIAPDLLLEMYRSLLAKGRHLRRDIAYSLHVMPTNHLLGDALGLVFLGYCFPEFHESAAWREFGLKVLFDQLPRQVRADGTSIESSISYHRFVLYFYVLADLLHRANGGTPPPGGPERLEKMIEVVQAVTKPDGTTSLYGDIDNAKAIFLSSEGPEDYRPTLATGAALFGRSDFKFTAGRLSQEVLWLLGPAGLEAWDRIEARRPAATAISFPEGGIHTWRSGWDRGADYLMLKCAPFTGHCEADLGHVDLAVGGRNLLVDGGTWTYNGPWEWRTYFRSTRAHNTVSVDGKSQALAHRSFRFLFHPDQIASCACPAGDAYLVDCEHRSYRFLGGIRHRRIVIIVAARYWVVVDCLSGRAGEEHEFGQHWHFDPAADVSLQPDTLTIRAVPPGGEPVWFVPASGHGLTAELVVGQEHPIQGWTSRGFGTRLPAPCVTYRWRGRLPSVQAVAVVRAEDAAKGRLAIRDAAVRDPAGLEVGAQVAQGLLLVTPERPYAVLIRHAREAVGRTLLVEGQPFAPEVVVRPWD
jgi:hypothetical protein